MVLKDNREELDLSFNFSHDDFNYVVYATTNSMKCLSCGEVGHLVRFCPKKDAKSNSEIPSVLVEKVGEVEGVLVAQNVSSEVPTTADVTLAEVNNVQPSVVDAGLAGSSGDAAVLEQKGIESVAAIEGASVSDERCQLTGGLYAEFRK